MKEKQSGDLIRNDLWIETLKGAAIKQIKAAKCR